MWRASRYGLGGILVSPTESAVRPAADVVAEFVGYVRGGLEAHGDLDEVEELVAGILARGDGASRQRRAFGGHRSGGGVMAHVLEETSPVAVQTKN